MLELKLDNQRIEGTPLTWNTWQVHLLGRDGKLWSFAPDDAADYRKTSNRFSPYSPSELRATLLRELGSGFEVSGTGHYMVAHPRGQRDLWAKRFEDLYRSFKGYFSVRGFQIKDPPFPLIGVVCRDRREFQRYASKHDGFSGAGVVGYYSIQSNRIILYDQGGGQSNSADWHETAATIIHEATHQTAFNTGIHSRYTMPPLWVVEGLATLFEAPGVYNSRYHTQQSDRINQGRLRDFMDHIRPNHRQGMVANLVASDRVFNSRPGVAYAEAWALTFYLVETQPKAYTKYLARTAKHPSFSDYTAEQRTADFTAVFGDDWKMFEARFLRFMDGVR
jgi:hypothetical protein